MQAFIKFLHEEQSMIVQKLLIKPAAKLRVS